jgi:uncharacterized protein YceK
MKKKCLLILLFVSLLLSGCDTSVSHDNEMNAPHETEQIKTTGDARPLSDFNQPVDIYIGHSDSSAWHKLDVGDNCLYGQIVDIDTNNGFWKDKKVFKIKVCTYNDLIVWKDAVWRDKSEDSVTIVELYKEENSVEVSASVKSHLVTSAGYINASASVSMKSTSGSMLGTCHTINYALDGYDTEHYEYSKALVADSAVLYAYVYCENPLIGGGWEFSSIEYDLVCDEDLTAKYIYRNK